MVGIGKITSAYTIVHVNHNYYMILHIDTPHQSHEIHDVNEMCKIVHQCDGLYQ